MSADDDTTRLQNASVFLGNNSSLATLYVLSFDEYGLRIWFAQLEAQFRNHKVTNEVDKFHHTIPLTDARKAANTEEIILNPPSPNRRNINACRPN